MSPGLIYPDDPRPAVWDVLTRYKKRFGVDINYLGEAAYAAASCDRGVASGRPLEMTYLLGGDGAPASLMDICGVQPDDPTFIVQISTAA